MQRLRIKRTWTKAVLILLVIGIVLGSVFAVNAKENTSSADQQEKSSPSFDTSSEGDAGWFNQQIFYAMHHRGTWLYDLMSATDTPPISDKSQTAAVFEEAYLRGIIGDYTDEDLHGPLDRRFVAQTTVKALGYQKKSIGKVSDLKKNDTDMQTLAYYSWFTPDAYNRLYPDQLITPEEYDTLLSELDRCRQLRGKKVLSFGDSIMYGAGNNGEGISDLIAQKYGMIVSDYAVSGASMGVSAGRSHICDQMRMAAANNEQADIILLNGATNDINHTDFGKSVKGSDLSKTDETSFNGGFEKAMWLLQSYWKNVPVVYVRVHDMDIATQYIEKRFGERGLEIARKWGASTVDLFRGSGMNTENPIICNRYTMKDPLTKESDSIHPTALGYAKFYLAPIGDAVTEQLMSEE